MLATNFGEFDCMEKFLGNVSKRARINVENSLADIDAKEMHYRELNALIKNWLTTGSTSLTCKMFVVNDI